METAFMIWGFISTIWSSVMGYTFHFDMGTIVMVGAFVVLFAFKRGAYP
ncbi:hypothetical protein [Pararhizobium qamdonense]|nr:hypothetical protein [Pararhizobium qamdonense]